MRRRVRTTSSWKGVHPSVSSSTSSKETDSPEKYACSLWTSLSTFGAVPLPTRARLAGIVEFEGGGRFTPPLWEGVTRAPTRVHVLLRGASVGRGSSCQTSRFSSYQSSPSPQPSAV